MDFLDPKKKRGQAIRLMVGYVLVGIAIALASFVLLLQAYGYDLNRQTGQVIQNGLVFVASHPVSADLYLNGAHKGTTSKRLTIEAGQYTVSLKQKGYRSWQRTFTLQGGKVEQLVYPVLFPTKLNTSDTLLYKSTPVFATQSPDRRWLLVQQPGLVTSFDNFDLNNPAAAPTNIILPSGLLSPSSSLDTLTLVEWSTDNRHVLVQHTYSGGNEFVMIDRQEPSSSYNVNKQFGVIPTMVALRNKRYDQLYLFDATTKSLQKAETKGNKITPLLTGVISFKAFGNNIVVYATDDSQTPGKNAIKIWDGKRSYLLHHYPSTAKYALDMATYNDHTYIVVAPVGGGLAYIYKDALNQAKQSAKTSPSPFTTLRLEQLAYVSFSANAQFIMAQSGSRFAVYDIERSHRYVYELKDLVTVDQKATWMDGHRVVLVINSKTFVFDFDGINQQTLTSSAAGLLPFFDRDYENLYNIAPSVQVPDRSALTRTPLIVK